MSDTNRWTVNFTKRKNTSVHDNNNVAPLFQSYSDNNSSVIQTSALQAIQIQYTHKLTFFPHLLNTVFTSI